MTAEEANVDGFRGRWRTYLVKGEGEGEGEGEAEDECQRWEWE